jgi:hypothetical protein
MVLDKYEKKYKEFIKAQDRLHKIEEELRKLPLRPLKVPFQKGWEVTIRLRDDIARRTDAPIIQKLIDLGYHKSYVTPKLSDVKAIRRGEKSVPYTDWRGRKGTRSLIPDKRSLTEEQFKELPLSLQKYLDFDRTCTTYIKWGRKTYHIYLPEYWLCLKARPNIITHQHIKGGELEKEEQELKDFLDEYWREWCGGYGRSWLPRWRDERPTIKVAVRKFLKGETEDVSL